MLPLGAERVSLVEIPDAVLATPRPGASRALRAATVVDAGGTTCDVAYPSDFGGDATSLFGAMRERRIAGAPPLAILGAIVDRALATAVGNMGTHAMPHAGRVEIGYTVAPAFASRGYATEMLRRFTLALGARDDVREIVAETLPHNAASQRVLEKCGFVRTGTRAGAAGPLVTWRLAARAAS